MRACSSPIARRDASAIAARRLRAASPNAHATTGNAIANHASPLAAVEKFNAVTPNNPASAASDTSGGRADASANNATSPAYGKIVFGASNCTTSPPASAISITNTGRERRHHNAAPCITPTNTPSTTSAAGSPAVDSDPTTEARYNPTTSGSATSTSR